MLGRVLARAGAERRADRGRRCPSWGRRVRQPRELQFDQVPNAAGRRVRCRPFGVPCRTGRPVQRTAPDGGCCPVCVRGRRLHCLRVCRKSSGDPRRRPGDLGWFLAANRCRRPSCGSGVVAGHAPAARAEDPAAKHVGAAGPQAAVDLCTVTRAALRTAGGGQLVEHPLGISGSCTGSSNQIHFSGRLREGRAASARRAGSFVASAGRRPRRGRHRAGDVPRQLGVLLRRDGRRVPPHRRPGQHVPRQSDHRHRPRPPQFHVRSVGP